MKCSWLRRISTLILGVVFVVSTSFSVVQAMEMAAMAGKATAAAGTGGDGKCPGCDPAKHDMKAMGCNLPVCPGPVLATLTQVPTVARMDGVDLPVTALPSLVGWAHAPDPYPPRARTLD